MPNPRVGPTRFLRRQSAAETLNSFFLEPIFERDLITRNRVQDSRHPVNQIRSVNITIDGRTVPSRDSMHLLAAEIERFFT